MRHTRTALAAALTTVLGLLLVPLSGMPAAHADSTTITGIAKDASGKPLPYMGWELSTWEDGAWTTLQFGPKITDKNGRFNIGMPGQGRYRVCFSDDYYDHAETPSGRWQPEVRHRDTCWPNATSFDKAETWSPSGPNQSKTFTVTLPRAGLGMAAVRPFVQGDYSIGKPLTVVGQERWRPTNAALTYQWVSHGDTGNWTPIPGATGASYTPTVQDEGRWVIVYMTGTRDGYKPVTLNSEMAKVGGFHAVPSSPLKITGVASPGNTLTATYGNTNNTYGEITWFADGVPVNQISTGDSNTSTLKLTEAHAGASIEARLSIYGQTPEGNYRDGSTTFHRVQVQVSGSRPVQALPEAPAPRGTATVGRVLSAPANVTADKDATLTYQWLRNAEPIAGATAARYELSASDLGAKVSVQVTVQRPGWTSTYIAYSDATLAKGTLKKGTLTTQGKARVGAKVTARVKGWGPKPVTIRHQWLRNGKAIKGATKPSYRLKKADRGKVIKVRIKATKSRYATVTRVSKGLRVRR